VLILEARLRNRDQGFQLINVVIAGFGGSKIPNSSVIEHHKLFYDAHKVDREEDEHEYGDQSENLFISGLY